MSQQSRIKQSRSQWKQKAGRRADENRYLRKELARVKKERDRLRKTKNEAMTRLQRLETQGRVIIIDHKLDLVFLALQLFSVAHIGFRAISRVLGVVAGVLGIKKKSHAPKPS